MSHETSTLRCAWCGKSLKCPASSKLPRDHIFPDFLGGTLDLAVHDCIDCNDKIQKIEQKVAKQSFWGVERALKGRRPRNKEKKSSGAVIPQYFFAKDSQGWYIDSTLKSSETHPVVLPSVQFSETKGAYFSGSPSDKTKLKRLLEKWACKSGDSGQLVAEFEFKKVEIPEIVADADFLPRLYLDIQDKPTIVARNIEEVKKYFSILMQLTRLGLTKNKGKSNGAQVVVAHTPHYLSVSIKKALLSKIASKIFIGSMHARAKKLSIDPFSIKAEKLSDLRSFLLSSDKEHNPAFIEDRMVDLSMKMENHFSLIIEKDGRLLGFVKIFQDFFKLDIGSTSNSDLLHLPFGIYCDPKGGNEKTRFLNDHEIKNIIQVLM